MRHNSKDRILAAATYEFSSRGYDTVTIKDIAKRANVSPGNIYLFYKDKETLLQDAISDTMKHVQNLCAERPAAEEQFFEGLLSISTEEMYSMQCILNTSSARDRLLGYITRVILSNYQEEENAERLRQARADAHLAARVAMNMVMEIAEHRSAFRQQNSQLPSIVRNTVLGIMTSVATPQQEKASRRKQG